MVAPIDRFYRHVRPEGDCLIWTSTKAGGKGYEYPTFRNTTCKDDPKVYAHRWIYEQEIGPIPHGWQVDHTCKRHMCVATAHLEAVPFLENMRRERLLVCRAGLHDLTDPANCQWDAQGRRRGCKLCKRAKSLARHQRLREGSSHRM
ncbi:HNH endonuclease [Mycobacterium phage Compostia]|nr:HNH endonuclease [Mycobacterium phage Compostia]